MSEIIIVENIRAPESISEPKILKNINLFPLKLELLIFKTNKRISLPS
jgi:hypothetical protein